MKVTTISAQFCGSSRLLAPSGNTSWGRGAESTCSRPLNYLIWHYLQSIEVLLQCFHTGFYPPYPFPGAVANNARETPCSGSHH